MDKDLRNTIILVLSLILGGVVILGGVAVLDKVLDIDERELNRCYKENKALRSRNIRLEKALVKLEVKKND